MSLSLQDASEALRPILVLYSVSADQQADYIAAISSACSWMDGYRFSQACQRVLKSAGPQRPKPRDYIRAYEALKEALGWPDKTSARCERCYDPGIGRSLGFVRVRVIPRGYVQPVDALAPCPQCNGSYRKPEGYVHVEAEEVE
ncbi:MAG: hypothetical protein QME77_13665 [bacterium]|nr:hypothetical protein [bacterium]